MYGWNENKDWPPKRSDPHGWVFVSALTLFFAGWLLAIYSKARGYSDSAWEAVISVMVIFTVIGIFLLAQPFVRKLQRRFERWREEDPPTG